MKSREVTAPLLLLKWGVANLEGTRQGCLDWQGWPPPHGGLHG